uniref:Uncharacterized protein n=1 Tax=Chromera velia CCMP2878 TaxID=1169474 RepID=A0A0G4ID41_9ALVE|eukprot:Cvel_13232.t1-p1 / transcript=Cvel_13232.t1 / gene=Cvel_13232 / organism=Chromera_velia_CCMP2878 / gene_product=hypothetical protein / transcript_product=hypothetical protein / location=Cvel_scaffold896:42574-49960(-) / protein_length=658 / sequence_SO=supercontig / SO=protein_coding / is_pseudo=false
MVYHQTLKLWFGGVKEEQFVAVYDPLDLFEDDKLAQFITVALVVCHDLAECEEIVLGACLYKNGNLKGEEIDHLRDICQSVGCPRSWSLTDRQTTPRSVLDALSSLEIVKEGGSVHPTLDPNCFCRGSVVQILDQGQPLWVVLWGYRRGVGGGSDYKGAKLVMHDKKDPFQGVGAQQRAGVIELLPVTVNGGRVSLDIERDITKVTVNKGTCLSTILKKCSWVNLLEANEASSCKMTRASENTDKGGTDREDSHALEKMKFRTKCFEKQLTLLAPLISHVCIPGICVLTLLLSIGLVPPATVLLFGGSLACWTVALAPGFLLRLIDMILNRRGRNDSSEAEETACSVSSLRERISFLAMMGHIICFHVGDVVNKKPPVLRAQEHGHHGNGQFEKMRGVCDDVLQMEKLDRGGFEFVFSSQDVRTWFEDVIAQTAPLFGTPISAAPSATTGGADLQTPPEDRASLQHGEVVGGMEGNAEEGSEERRSSSAAVSSTAVRFSWHFDVSSEIEETKARKVSVADFRRLEQVIGNFVSNAHKFTQRGEVRVEAQLRAPSKEECKQFLGLLRLPPDPLSPQHVESKRNGKKMKGWFSKAETEKSEKEKRQAALSSAINSQWREAVCELCELKRAEEGVENLLCNVKKARKGGSRKNLLILQSSE